MRSSSQHNTRYSYPTLLSRAPRLAAARHGRRDPVWDGLHHGAHGEGGRLASPYVRASRVGGFVGIVGTFHLHAKTGGLV